MENSESFKEQERNQGEKKCDDKAKQDRFMEIRRIAKHDQFSGVDLHAYAWETKENR